MKQNWEIKKLSEIGKVFNGNSINEKVKKDNYTGLDEGLPFIATKDVGFDSIIDYENGVKIPFTKHEQFKIAPANTPLICAEGGSAGRKIGFTNQDVCFGNKLFALVPNKNVNSKFLFYYYFSSSFQKYFSTEMTGIIGGVSMNKFKDIEIPLPPLPEQQRIVSLLDEAFAVIAKAKANAEQNLKNAKELFESYLQGVFEKKGEGWEVKKLGEIVKYDKKQNIHKGLPYVGLEHIESSSGSFLGSIEPQEVKSSTFHFDEQHVLYGRLRPYLNKVLLPNFEGHCSTEIFPIKVNKQVVREFLFYWLIAGSTVKKIDATWTGARMPRANMNQVLEFDFALPSIKEQQTIVQKLNALRTETQKLESVYQKKIDDLEELKKSILQKAFAGELKTEKAVVI